MSDIADPLTSVGFKVDRPSQKMLLALNKRDRLRGASLRKSAELSQNTQVFYRMEEHLIPAGLVEEHDRRHEQDQRRFSLTEHGASWLEAHEEEVAMPKSRVETQQMAHEALEEASSAKDSVQSYRKKLNRLKTTTEDDLDDFSDTLDKRLSRLREVENLASSNDYGLDIVSNDVDGIEGRVETLEGNHSDMKEWTKKRFKSQQEEIEELQAALSAAEEKNAELQAEIKEMQRSRLDRLKDRFGDD
jgi:DNA repair exonuclease SbcCD ATPase subunit